MEVIIGLAVYGAAEVTSGAAGSAVVLAGWAPAGRRPGPRGRVYVVPGSPVLPLHQNVSSGKLLGVWCRFCAVIELIVRNA